MRMVVKNHQIPETMRVDAAFGSRSELQRDERYEFTQGCAETSKKSHKADHIPRAIKGSVQKKKNEMDNQASLH